MNRSFRTAALVLAALALPALASAAFKFRTEWLSKPVGGFGAYAAPKVSYSDAGLRRIVKGKEDEKTYLERGAVVLDKMAKVVDDRMPDLKWSPKGKPLTAEVVLGNLFTGNGAARFFGGLPGNFQVNVIYKSGGKKVAELEMVLPIGKSVPKAAGNAGAYIVKYTKKEF